MKETNILKYSFQFLRNLKNIKEKVTLVYCETPCQIPNLMTKFWKLKIFDKLRMVIMFNFNKVNELYCNYHQLMRENENDFAIEIINVIIRI